MATVLLTDEGCTHQRHARFNVRRYRWTSKRWQRHEVHDGNDDDVKHARIRASSTRSKHAIAKRAVRSITKQLHSSGTATTSGHDDDSADELHEQHVQAGNENERGRVWFNAQSRRNGA